MTIKTSRFKNISRFGQGETPLSISRWSPSWYYGKAFQKLAPPGELVLHSKKHGITKDDYYFLYKEDVLDKLDPVGILKEIESIYPNAILLCHEDLTVPGEWCHRRMVADWLSEANGVEIPEWVDPPKARTTFIF